MAYQLPLEITRKEHIWMARSGAIKGFLATGETLDQLFGEVPDVAQALYAVCREKGWLFADILHRYRARAKRLRGRYPE